MNVNDYLFIFNCIILNILNKDSVRGGVTIKN